MQKTITTLYLDSMDWLLLKQSARAKGVSVSEVARQAIRRYLDQEAGIVPAKPKLS